MKEVDEQLNLIVKNTRDLKHAEDVNDWDAVTILSDKLQDNAHEIGKIAQEMKVAMKK